MKLAIPIKRGGLPLSFVTFAESGRLAVAEALRKAAKIADRNDAATNVYRGTVIVSARQHEVRVSDVHGTRHRLSPRDAVAVARWLTEPYHCGGLDLVCRAHARVLASKLSRWLTASAEAEKPTGPDCSFSDQKRTGVIAWNVLDGPRVRRNISYWPKGIPRRSAGQADATGARSNRAYLRLDANGVRALVRTLELAGDIPLESDTTPYIPGDLAREEDSKLMNNTTKPTKPTKPTTKQTATWLDHLKADVAATGEGFRVGFEAGVVEDVREKSVKIISILLEEFGMPRWAVRATPTKTILQLAAPIGVATLARWNPGGLIPKARKITAVCHRSGVAAGFRTYGRVMRRVQDLFKEIAEAADSLVPEAEVEE